MNNTDNIIKLVEEKDFFVRIACWPVFENGSDNLEVSKWRIDKMVYSIMKEYPIICYAIHG